MKAEIEKLQEQNKKLYYKNITLNNRINKAIVFLKTDRIIVKYKFNENKHYVKLYDRKKELINILEGDKNERKLRNSK